MKLECTFKKMVPQEKVMEYAQSKLEKVEHVVKMPLHCRITLIAQRYDVKVEIRVDGNHVHYNASAEHESVYQAIDMASEKMHKQLTKKKSKMMDRRGKRLKKAQDVVETRDFPPVDYKKAN